MSGLARAEVRIRGIDGHLVAPAVLEFGAAGRAINPVVSSPLLRVRDVAMFVSLPSFETPTNSWLSAPSARQAVGMSSTMESRKRTVRP